MIRRNDTLLINEADRLQLQSMVRSHSMPHSLVRRARIILLSGDGQSNRAVAQRCGVSAPAVSHWRRRYQERGLAGLHDEPRPGRPRTHDDEEVAALIKLVVGSKPEHATHWSVSSAAAHTGIPKSTVGRYFALFGLQPRRSKDFKSSTALFFSEKVRDIVGLYLNPPDNTLVLCVDEKSQLQALKHTQSMLPLSLRCTEDVICEYYCHYTSLFAALEILHGKLIRMCKLPNRQQQFLAFMNQLDQSVPERLDIHLISHNCGTPESREVRAWFAKRPRYHLHYTPTYGHWLKQLERWFGLIMQQAIRRGSFRNVGEIVQKIDTYVSNYNMHKQPLIWTVSTDTLKNDLISYSFLHK